MMDSDDVFWSGIKDGRSAVDFDEWPENRYGQEFKIEELIIAINFMAQRIAELETSLHNKGLYV